MLMLSLLMMLLLSQPVPSLSWYRADSLATILGTRPGFEVQEDREDWRLAEVNTREQAEIIEEVMRNNSCEYEAQTILQNCRSQPKSI